jgi:hypothetical protein
MGSLNFSASFNTSCAKNNFCVDKFCTLGKNYEVRTSEYVECTQTIKNIHVLIL